MNTRYIQLDAFQSAKARDAGMQQASGSAERKAPGWNDRAYAFLLQWLLRKNKKENFFIEDVREAAALAGIPAPPSARAWGSVTVKAAKEGFIKRVGYGKVSNKNAHCTPASIWQKA